MLARRIALHRAPIRRPGLLSRLGPGLITGASDDDPSGIATYSQAGAQFGFAMCWVMLFTFPLMAAIQADQPIRLDADSLDGYGSTLDPNAPAPSSEPSPAGSGSPDPTATDDPGPAGVVVSGVRGQSADQYTCSQSFQF
ncbi:MAG: divalent metal cation transporter [Rhodospirillales bacterium]|nr:divalent metal cation transporter [Rhodospirillales bacterium]